MAGTKQTKPGDFYQVYLSCRGWIPPIPRHKLGVQTPSTRSLPVGKTRRQRPGRSAPSSSGMMKQILSRSKEPQRG